MPENAWQESRDTGLRHLSVGVALYAGLCSGFMLLYAPAFLSLLSLFEKWFGGPGNPHLFLSPSSSLVSCDLFVSMRVIHQKN